MGYGLPRPAAAQFSPRTDRRQEQHVRTLIVDDLPDMRFLMRVTLWSPDNVDVTDEAESGEDALAVWDELRHDVVVLDMNMPGLSGLEVARLMLREHPGQRVVMCSAYMDQNDIAVAKEIGVAACVDKYEIATLPEVVEAVVGAA
jgi:CheY-like chemotaxis protein